jgi:hypothetical protein
MGDEWEGSVKDGEQRGRAGPTCACTRHALAHWELEDAGKERIALHRWK